MINEERIVKKLKRERNNYNEENNNDGDKATYEYGRYCIASEILFLIEDNKKIKDIIDRLTLEIYECDAINENEGGLTDFGKGHSDFAEELLELITSLQSVKDKSNVINELKKDIIEMEHIDEFERDLSEVENAIYYSKVEMLELLIANEKEETVEELEKKLRKLKAKKYNYVIFDKLVTEELTEVLDLQEDLRNEVNKHINLKAKYRVLANRTNEKTIVVKIFNFATGELEGKGKSICHDEDEFDLELGCRIAQYRAKANVYERNSKLY